jgi:hypothetical protein
MSQRPISDDMITVTACGVFSATLAAIFHETLGHALTCIAEGGQLTLLTSIWIRCRGASNLWVVAGPLASLIGGLIGLALLRRQSISGVQRLALTLFSGFNLFWFAGQLILHPLTDGDTWAFLAHRLQWPWIWRPIAAGLGGLCYVTATLAITDVLRNRGFLASSSILIGYAAGAASAALAGLMWAAMPIRSAMEGLLALGIAPIGLIAIAVFAGHYRSVAGLPVLRSNTMAAVSFTFFILFLMLQGRGLGSMASAGLPN